MQLILSLVFSIGFVYFVNRMQVHSFLQGLFNKTKNNKIKDITDKKILDWIYKKTGVRLKKISVYDMQDAWGMMAGIPTKPYMILAQNAIDELSAKEIEWLYLHEVGHYVLHHPLKLAFWQISLVIIGIIFLNIYTLLPLITILSIIYFQFARKNEYEANEFAIKRMDHPEGAISVVEKARRRWLRRGTPLQGWSQTLFNIWTFDIYLDLAKVAKLETEHRKQVAKLVHLKGGINNEYATN